MQMVFNELYIFSSTEKLARRIEFSAGINIVTSSKKNGNQRGKSVVLKCLYFALGAETKLDDTFRADDKVVILRLTIDGSCFYILRAGSLHKIFDDNMTLLFRTVKASDFAEWLAGKTKFAVRLPDRNNKRLVVTPPVYNYLPYYLDQDCYSGSQFESFNKLQQFKDYKADVLGYHFGVYNEEYYGLKMRVEDVEKKKRDEECREVVQQGILASIQDKLQGRACPQDLDSLRFDLECRQEEYVNIVSQMNQVRQDLLEKRNALYDLNEVEEELADFESENEGEIQVLNQHRCPECHTVLHDTVWLRSPRYNLAENIVLLKRDLQVNREVLADEVKKGETQYVMLLEQMKLLEREIGKGSSDVKDLLRFRGLNEVYEDSVRESRRVRENLDGYEKELAMLKKAIAHFRKKRVLINKEYETILIEDSARLGLKKIKKERFKSYELNFNAGGSDKCLATVMWHFAILRVRNRFNAQAIKFPIVFDSPNNVESDEEKTKLLIRYLLDNASLSGQFIISGIGLKDNEAISLQNRSDIHWVVLESEQYHLLQEDDYNAYRGVMDVLIATGREKS